MQFRSGRGAVSVPVGKDHAVSGWCPTAWRPMMAGDGLIVRVRPPLSRLTAAQGTGLCAAAVRHGNGLIDLTNRANLQLRGVGEAAFVPLLDELVALGLVDGDPVREGRRAILIAPDWQAGDASERIAAALLARLGDLPDLPAKMGFAIDAGAAPMLSDCPADFRVERGEDGGLILRADGRATGVPVEADDAAEALVALAHWFMASGGAEAGRMARHTAPLPDWAAGDARPAPVDRPVLQDTYGVPFGRMEATALALLIEQSGAQAIRATPWRALLLEDAAPVQHPAFITEADHPAMQAQACPGAPACPQASVETRPLALALAPHVAAMLHVSGCSKGCAHGGAAGVMLTGRAGLFDLAFDACAGDPPVRRGLTPAAILSLFGAA